MDDVKLVRIETANVDQKVWAINQLAEAQGISQRKLLGQIISDWYVANLDAITTAIDAKLQLPVEEEE
jgi:hypothetical protein